MLINGKVGTLQNLTLRDGLRGGLDLQVLEKVSSFIKAARLLLP